MNPTAMTDQYKCRKCSKQKQKNSKSFSFLIYELLDEMMDYGIPQILETEVLKQYIFEGGL